jgi:hypothetical protein
MKPIYILAILITLTSCFPTKIAPKFKRKGYKVINAKKFNDQLLNENAFIFSNPKPNINFYTYINNTYKLNHTIKHGYKSEYLDKGVRIPISIENESYYLSYYVAERTSELHLIPFDGPFIDTYNYIVIYIHDDKNINCLTKNYDKKEMLINYLINLKNSYLNNPYY